MPSAVYMRLPRYFIRGICLRSWLISRSTLSALSRRQLSERWNRSWAQSSRSRIYHAHMSKLVQSKDWRWSSDTYEILANDPKSYGYTPVTFILPRLILGCTIRWVATVLSLTVPFTLRQGDGWYIQVLQPSLLAAISTNFEKLAVLIGGWNISSFPWTALTDAVHKLKLSSFVLASKMRCDGWRRSGDSAETPGSPVLHTLFSARKPLPY